MLIVSTMSSSSSAAPHACWLRAVIGARVRLHAVMAAVGAGERNLRQAALQSGFGSYAQFHRVVRNMTGLAPHRLLSPDGRALLSRRTALLRELG